MSIRRAAYRTCDHPSCAVWDAADGPKVHHHITGDFCVCHYPLPRCHTCGRRLRPYRATVALWPGTVDKASSNPPTCSACYTRGKRRKPRKMWTCWCGAKTQAGDKAWWRTKFYGPLCPEHRHPLCAVCFQPMRSSDETPDGTTRRYWSRGRCTSCADGRTRVDMVTAEALESVKRIVPRDLWWYLGIREE